MERASVSTIIRKPWGGQLAAERDYPAQRQSHDMCDTVLLLVRKLAELLLLASLVAVPLMYHFSLPVERIIAIREFVDKSPFYFQHVEPWLTGSMPALESKFSTWAVLGIMMICAYATLRILEYTFHRWFRVGLPPESQPAVRTIHRRIPLFAIAGFLVYSLVSFLVWPPDMPAEAHELAGVSVGDSIGSISTWIAEHLGGGGFFFSVTAWVQVAFGLFFFLVCEDLIRRRSFVSKIFGLLIFVGLLNAMVTILQKLQFGPIVNNWVRFADSDTRNQLGAFIGHNTGVASYLMAPLFVCVAWMLSVQPYRMQVFRAGLAVSSLFFILAMLLTQSRAVIPIAVVVTVLLVVLLYRRSALLSRSRLYVWFPVLLVFVLLTQIVPSRVNMLYRRDISLIERVGEFTPDRLLTETRLRILAVSMSRLVPASPLIGHGFGTFQYVYPEAQGEYFRANPDSALAPTPFRTKRAHNEYLQLLIETGVVGLIIAVLGLAYLMRGGWSVFQRTLMPHHIAAQASVFCGIIGLLLHCGADFPLRIPPLAHLLVVLLAIWSAGDRLWLFPMKPPLNDEEIPIPVSGKEDRPATESPRLRRAFALAMTVVVATVTLGCAVLLNALIVNPFQSASLYALRAETFLKMYLADQRQLPYYYQAFEDVRLARRIYWLSGPVARLNGQERYVAAKLTFQEADSYLDQNKFREAAQTRNLARTYADAGLSDLNMALTDEKFHTIYQLRSTIYDLLARNTTGGESAVYFAQMIEDLKRAINMNPGDPEAVFHYVQVLDSMERAEEEEEILGKLRLLHHFHRDYFEMVVFGQVLDALSMNEGGEAMRRIRRILAIEPRNNLYIQVAAGAALSAGDENGAREYIAMLLNRIQGGVEDPALRENATMLQIRAAILSGDMEEAQKLMTRTKGFTTVGEPTLLAFELYLLKAPETASRREEIRRRLDALGRQSPINYQITGTLAANVFGDDSEAVQWLEKRRDIRNPEMDIQGYATLARAYARLEDWSKVRDLIPKLREKSGPTFAGVLARELASELDRQLPDELREKSETLHRETGS